MTRRDMLSKMIFMGAVMASGLSIMTGCGVPVTTWVQLATTLLATVLPTIPALIQTFSNLIGKSVLTAAQVAKLTTIFNNVQSLLNTANADLVEYEATSNPTLVASIETILAEVKSSLSTVITDVGITDPATITKITGIAQTFIDLADNILAVLPTVSTTGKLMAKKMSKAKINKVTAKVWAAEFNEAVQKPCGNKVIDDAFAQVKAKE